MERIYKKVLSSQLEREDRNSGSKPEGNLVGSGKTDEKVRIGPECHLKRLYLKRKIRHSL